MQKYLTRLAAFPPPNVKIQIFFTKYIPQKGILPVGG